MTHLYVAHFSNGHIKVGRSIDPLSRIATHADRVACLGVQLVEHFSVLCVGSVAQAESDLINRCAAEADKRNNSEWFEGLDYPTVCDWAIECAACSYQVTPLRDLLAYLNALDSKERDAFCARCKTTQGYLRKACSTGQRIGASICIRIEIETAGAVRCETLRPDVDWAYIRNSIHPIARAT